MSDQETRTSNHNVETEEAQQKDKPGRSFALIDYTEITNGKNYFVKDGKKRYLNEKNEIVQKAVADAVAFLKQEDTQNHYILITGGDPTDEQGEQGGLLNYWCGNIFSGQYAGLLMDEKNDDVYFLHSRFDPDEECSFTNYLLSKAFDIKCRAFPDMQIQREPDQFMQHLLALIFLEQIKKAYKSGIFRCYRNFEENNSRVRGRIQLERHIKLNPIFNGTVAYTYREYTPNNDINRIILTAYDFLLRRNGSFMRGLLRNAKYREVKTFFMQLGNITTPASRQEVQRLLKNNKKPIHHSVYRNWENVRKTAIQILRHMGICTYESGQAEVSGILIDMPKIWEAYLAWVLGNISEFAFETQKSKKILNGKRMLRPDYLDEKKHRIVMDAKYKNAWAETLNNNGNKVWPREDTFQILSYMYVFHCDIGVIICPSSETSEKRSERIFYPVSEEMKDKWVAVLPIVIPGQQENYRIFEEKMQESEKALCESLKALPNLIKEEKNH